MQQMAGQPKPFKHL